MTAVEDRLRAAARAAPPLRLPVGRGFGRRRVGAWGRWVAPVAAAVSVLAVLGGLLAAGVFAPGRTSPARSGRSPAAHPATRYGLPAYLWFSPAHAPGETVAIVAMATGRIVATARLPGHGGFRVAADDEGRFYAAVPSGSGTTSFYRIGLAAAGQSATVTRLPIPAVPAEVGRLSAAPDGSRLAFSTYVLHGHAPALQNLIVASTTTGSEHRWTVPLKDLPGSIGPMQWLANGRVLAFNWLGSGSAAPSSLRLLDTQAPGSDLLAGHVLRVRGFHQLSDLAISPDGNVLIGIANHLTSPATMAGQPLRLGYVIKFSARSGRAILFYRTPTVWDAARRRYETSTCYHPLWLSNSGQQVLLMCTEPRPQGGTVAAIPHVLLLDHGRVIQLPWLDKLFGG
jgi:hypothetical protein